MSDLTSWCYENPKQAAMKIESLESRLSNYEDTTKGYERDRYLVKCEATGTIDTETQYPVSKSEAERTGLVEGYKWVEVSTKFTEMGDL